MIESLLRRVAFQLDKEKISYMVIGGQAVLLYGQPRLTRDIDITLGADSDEFPRIRKVCRKLGLRMLPKDPERFAKTTKVLPAADPKSKMRVDFIFSFSPYEDQALKRTRKVRIKGYSVKFASCEDVIIHKLFAGRAVDDEDLKGILAKNRKAINPRYIRKWLSAFESIPGGERILKRLDRLLKQS